MTRNNFRLIVVSQLFMTLIQVILSESSLNQNLPQELSIYKSAHNFLDKDNGIQILISLVFGLPTLIAEIGLYFFKNWARVFFSIGTILCYSITIFADPVVETGLETFFGGFSCLLDGLIIGLINFSVVKTYFHSNKISF